VSFVRRVLPALLAASTLLAACSPSPVPVPTSAPVAAAGRSTAATEPVPAAAPAPAAPAPAVSAPAAPAVAQPDPTATPKPERPGLDGVLDRVASRHQARLGVVVEKLTTGERGTLNPNQHVRAASLYKLWVLHSTFARIDAGKLSKAETLALTEKALVHEPYAEWPLGTRTSVDCSLQAMIGFSSNAATAMLIERLGGETQITADMYDLGLTHSFVTPDYAGTTPSDLAALLAMIYRKQAISPASSEAMLTLLSGQQRNDRIPLPLPLDVRVAHKTGELARLRHDAGIVFAPSGPYLLVATAESAPSEVAARDAIVDLSQTVYAYFEGTDPPSYQGMPPRLAREVFQLPDAKGRLEPMADAWGQTVPLASAGVAVAATPVPSIPVAGAAAAGAARDITLRGVAVADLAALQRAATASGAPFWVTSGYRAPAAGDPGALPIDVLPCPLELPPPKPKPTGTPAPTPTPVPLPASAVDQQWLGTVVTIADAPTGEASAVDFARSATGEWLLRNAWSYGFVPALPETSEDSARGYVPWTLRWVGRPMASRLHQAGAETGPGLVAELRTVGRDLSTQPERRKTPA
jgi:beta-lactamase class A